MRKLFIISALLFSCMLKAQDTNPKTVRTENVTVQVTPDNLLQVSMDIVLPAKLRVSSNQMMIFTPVIQNSGKETTLTPIYIYGRKREIINERKNRLPLEGSVVVRRTNRKEQVIEYKTTVPYSAWMKGADVVLEEDLCGCGNHTEENNSHQLAQVILPEPPAIIDQPLVVEAAQPAKEKQSRRRVYEGKAFIDFPVNKTVIYPRYRKNPEELARIDSTLTLIGIENISRITLHGYASPESPYTHNSSLAKGRTLALKQHIMDKYHLNDSTFTIESTPEDWDGLIRLAEQCDWTEKDRILEIARSDAQPDEKERQLRRLVDAYLRMSWYWFPALRHTDYRIEFNEITEE